jgi:hypothetical protein
VKKRDCERPSSPPAARCFASHTPIFSSHSKMPMPLNPLAGSSGLPGGFAHSVVPYLSRKRSCESWCDEESCEHVGCFDCGPDLRPELGCPAKHPPSPPPFGPPPSPTPRPPPHRPPPPSPSPPPPRPPSHPPRPPSPVPFPPYPPLSPPPPTPPVPPPPFPPARCAWRPSQLLACEPWCEGHLSQYGNVICQKECKCVLWCAADPLADGMPRRARTPATHMTTSTVL